MEWKRAILRLAEQELQGIALEEPPVSDTVAGMVCPQCGQTQANIKAVYDHEVTRPEGEEPEQLAVAVCGACGCEFTPIVESRAKAVLDEVFKRRARRMRAASDPQRQFQNKQAIFKLLSR